MKMKRQTKKVKSKQLPTPSSITCGTDNPASLGCEFYELEGGEVATCFVAREVHEGHRGIMHGGLSGAVLDEVMGRSTLSYDQKGQQEWVPKYVTAEMTTKYRKPIAIGQQMFAYGRIERSEGRLAYATSEILDDSGEIMATAQGVYVMVENPQDQKPGYKPQSGKRAPLTEKDPKEL